MSTGKRPVCVWGVYVPLARQSKPNHPPVFEVHVLLSWHRYQRAIKRCGRALIRAWRQQRAQLAVLSVQWDALDRERVESVAKASRERDLALAQVRVCS